MARARAWIGGLTLAAALPAWAEGPAAAAAPVFNGGDIAWMLISTVLVLLMTMPGIILFYSGMLRTKNALSIVAHTVAAAAVITLCWAMVGYSLAFSHGSPFFGGLERVFGEGLIGKKVGAHMVAPTIPESVFFLFQLSFAIITFALVLGATAERMRLGVTIVFAALWSTLIYAPVAHWVWHPEGWLAQQGHMDFAGGTVVHINAGVAALVGAYAVGPRIGYRRESMAPHSLTMTLVGASLLFVGWFGFNVGSALEAGATAGLAFFNTLVATCAATVAWTVIEALFKGKPSMLGAVSGAIAGLVVITPACGLVGPMGAVIMGFLGGIVCYWGVNGLKRMLGVDDSLDVFGVHGVGGILGALLTGVFASPELGGAGVWDYVANAPGTFDMGAQLVAQAWGVGTAVVWSGVVSYIAFKLIDLTIGLRVTEDEEREGLDLSAHGESAYHA